MKTPELVPWPGGSSQSPATGEGESRTQVLASYGLDELEDDPELERIVRFAARLCETPIAIISMVEKERQRFLALKGLKERETPRSVSFCAYAMLAGEVMEVADATQDPRFADNALVTGDPSIRFYAGQPLVSDDGVPLGSLCVIDTAPRPHGLTALQREGLEVLGLAVMRRLGSRRADLEARAELEQSEAQLRALADSIPAIAWSADENGKFDYFNKHLLDFTGREENYHGEAFHPEDLKAASVAWQESLRTGEPYEIEHRMCRHDGEYRWMIARAVPLRDQQGKIIRWFGTAVDIHDLHAMADARDLLARELSHRIKNIFAVVCGLITLSVRKHPEHAEFAEGLMGRIRALGRAHEFVRPGDTEGPRDTLGGLLQQLFAPYGSGDYGRVRIDGYDLPINPRAATPLALVFHELATNSAKYGALSTDAGHIDLDVRDGGDTVFFCWNEVGGPPPPKDIDQATGFGTRLVDTSITGQLGGQWERKWREDGLLVEIEVSRKVLAASGS
ncbi:sensor histidine kinase [Altericroceibacterium xinjiangense]|uniref:sensor histidine kinase n=1 Tax=Altericroceibacterium xinjiangense TaxID=762261 RepID=UPI000F7D80C0|nr:PAS domain-containing protein [Altericroceibacterium xinjiangense]